MKILGIETLRETIDVPDEATGFRSDKRMPTKDSTLTIRAHGEARDFQDIASLWVGACNAVDWIDDGDAGEYACISAECETAIESDAPWVGKHSYLFRRRKGQGGFHLSFMKSVDFGKLLPVREWIAALGRGALATYADSL